MKRPPPPDYEKIDAANAKMFSPVVCEQIKQQRQTQQTQTPPPKVLMVNKDAYLLWCEVAGIWAIGAMGGLLGIDWARAESVLRLQRCKVKPDAIRACRVIESACVSKFNSED